MHTNYNHPYDDGINLLLFFNAFVCNLKAPKLFRNDQRCNGELEDNKMSFRNVTVATLVSTKLVYPFRNAHLTFFIDENSSRSREQRYINILLIFANTST